MVISLNWQHYEATRWHGSLGVLDFIRRQGVFVQGQAERWKGLQPAPAARHTRLLLCDEVRAELRLRKRTLTDDRLKDRIDDVLRQRGVTADVPLRRLLQSEGRDFAEAVAQVKIVLG